MNGDRHTRISREGRGTKSSTDSREKIIWAAIRIFAEKGKQGTRMEEIAAEAKVNKAMVYYYHSTRDSLFRAVLTTVLRRVYSRIFEILDVKGDRDADAFEKVALLTDAHLTAFSEDVRFAKILLHALSNEPQDLKTAVRYIRNQEEMSDVRLPDAFLSDLEEGIRKRELREADANRILISIIGMSLISFIDKPIAETLLDRKVGSDEAFLKEGGKSTIELLLHGVLGKEVFVNRHKREVLR